MNSLRKSIDNKCKDCTYDPSNGGNWREQVEDCRVKVCPLWEVRPVTIATKKETAKKLPPERAAKARAQLAAVRLAGSKG